MQNLTRSHPWIKLPLVTSAPMRLIAQAKLAVEVSKAGGIGFIGSGNDQSNLAELLEEARRLCDEAGLTRPTLPVGVGFINWGADIDVAIPLIEKFVPAAVWLFAPRDVGNIKQWSERVRQATSHRTDIWVQVGSVEEAVRVTKACSPGVLVVQGSDAGGHGLNQGASIISLVPEVKDRLEQLNTEGNTIAYPYIIATGGISDGRGFAAAVMLGADGICMGTRYLASEEAVITKGYQNEILRASDGGQTTIRSSVYDKLRGTTDWPAEYGGRGVINQSYHDSIAGMPWEENIKLYNAAIGQGDGGWGPQQRMTTYAGTGVGLVVQRMPAGVITNNVREDCLRCLQSANTMNEIP